jgi:hypothetical protein
VYNTYLESNLFIKDFEKIKGRDGEEIALLYEYVAKNMCEYYLLSKGNKSKSEITIQSGGDGSSGGNNNNDESCCSFNNDNNRYNISMGSNINNNNINTNENNLNSFSLSGGNQQQQVNTLNKKLVFNINNE